MARRYQVTHRTSYAYEEEVTASYGRTCLTPRDLPDQVCRDARLTVDPAAALIRESVDFFGNRAGYFEVHEPHRELVVTAASEVEVTRQAVDLAGLDGWTWQQARDRVRADRSLEPEATGYRLPSPRLPLAGRLPGFAAELLVPGRPLGELLAGLIHRIHDDFAYRAGTTTVGTTLDDVLTRREGVCQDFAHLAVATLRWAGLPARYVSGYLETSPPPGQPKLQGADASHAWASVLVPDAGWVDLDPTNNKVVDESFVVTGWGRDYTDVPPLKGVIFTESGSSTMKVAVDVTRL